MALAQRSRERRQARRPLTFRDGIAAIPETPINPETGETKPRPHLVHWSELGFAIKHPRELERLTTEVVVTGTDDYCVAFQQARDSVVRSAPHLERFAIQRGIPIPEAKRVGRKSGRKQQTKYPFAQMEVGDSFFVPCEPHRTVRSLSASLGGILRDQFIRFGTEFTQRSREDRGVRVWRVS